MENSDCYSTKIDQPDTLYLMKLLKAVQVLTQRLPTCFKVWIL